jgi:hypothetical protein
VDVNKRERNTQEATIDIKEREKGSAGEMLRNRWSKNF